MEKKPNRELFRFFKEQLEICLERQDLEKVYNKILISEASGNLTREQTNKLYFDSYLSQLLLINYRST